MSKLILFILTSLTIISCGGGPKPKGIYHGNKYKNDDSYVFKENGIVLVCHGKLENEHCLTEGHWETDSKGNVIISGLNNKLCGFMNRLNGTYMIYEGSQCSPNGKGFIKYDQEIEPLLICPIDMLNN